MATRQTISFLGVGDCGPVHGPAQGFSIERYSELVRPTLATADLRFANCERQYSARRTQGGLTPHGCQPPEMAKIFLDCGFDAVTVANNHMYDFGPDAMLDTRTLLLGHGIQVTGAGKNLEEARKPAIVERKGINVGFLGYCSVIPHGGEAGPEKAGIAPLRFKQYYEPRGLYAPMRIRSEPDENDLRIIVEDVKALRKQVDVVMVAFHWGVIWVPRAVADYQVAAAHAVIDAGADLVMGHHQHLPKGIEMYKGRAIFYGMSNFCMTKPYAAAAWKEPAWVHGSIRNYTDLDPDYPLLPYGKDARRSLMVKAILSKNGVEQVSFIPLLIDREYRPEVLRRGDPRFDDMVSYMDWTSDGFDHRFHVEGDEVVVTPA